MEESKSRPRISVQGKRTVDGTYMDDFASGGNNVTPEYFEGVLREMQEVFALCGPNSMVLYDPYYAVFTVSFVRQETDEEYALRLRAEDEAKAAELPRRRLRLQASIAAATELIAEVDAELAALESEYSGGDQ